MEVIGVFVCTRKGRKKCNIRESEFQSLLARVCGVGWVVMKAVSMVP